MDGVGSPIGGFCCQGRAVERHVGKRVVWRNWVAMSPSPPRALMRSSFLRKKPFMLSLARLAPIT